MGAQAAIGRRPRTQAELEAILAALVDRVTRRMRAAHRVGHTVTIRLRFHDYRTRVTRSHTLVQATSHTPTVLGAARRLLVAARPLIEENGITLVGVAVSNLDDDNAVQLALPFNAYAGTSLDAAVDAVRDRFGSRALTRAAMVGRELAPAVPLLPD